MNQELQKQLAALIEKATAAGQNAWDFAAQQAPELIQQLLRWKLWEASFWAVILLLAFIGFAYMARRGFRLLHSGCFSDADGLGAPMAFFGTLGAGVFLFGFICNASDAIQILVAPKIYLIEYISHLTK